MSGRSGTGQSGTGRAEQRRGGEASQADVFGYSAGDVTGQGMRNMLALLTLPWAMAWMLQSEMIAEAMRHFGE